MVKGVSNLSLLSVSYIISQKNPLSLFLLSSLFVGGKSKVWTQGGLTHWPYAVLLPKLEPFTGKCQEPLEYLQKCFAKVKEQGNES